MFDKQTIKDVDISGKTVLIREDFNVPIDENGLITEDYRLRQALPTIEHALGHKARVVLIAHLGRPEGKIVPSLTLMPVATKLSDLLHLPVKFASDSVGKSAKSVVSSLQPGQVALLENLRFNPGEEANDPKFAKELASLADVFIQDGFGVAYRKHASTEAITHFLPSVAGLLLEKEVKTILAAVTDPPRPLAVVIGGGQIAEKLSIIDKFIDIADYVAVVGAVANTFLKAQGVAVGQSMVDNGYLKAAKEVLEKAFDKMQTARFAFYLPHDVVVAEQADTTAKTRIVDISEHTWADIVTYPKQPASGYYTVQNNERILDIGPVSAASIAGSLKMSRTVVFNGPAGMTEIGGLHGAADPFAHGTAAILEVLIGEQAGLLAKPSSVIAGADTVAYVEARPEIRDRLDFLSTGGGASLELLAGKSLPGVDSLMVKNIFEGGN